MFIGLSGTTGSFLFGGVRLRKVEMWLTANGTSSGLLTGAITLLGDRTANRSHQVFGSLTEPGHIVVRPKPGTFHDMWFDGNELVPSLGTASSAAFSLSGPASTIVDVTVSFQLVDYSSYEMTGTITSSGTSAGVLYTNEYLDNTSAALANGTKNWTISQIGTGGIGYISAWG
jgi:hypothetical protein